MPEMDEASHLKHELTRLRRDLGYYLLQKAKYSGSPRDKEIYESIGRIREEILNIKRNLERLGVSVDDTTS